MELNSYILERTDKSGRKTYRNDCTNTKKSLFSKLDKNTIIEPKEDMIRRLKVFRKKKDGMKYKIIPVVKIPLSYKWVPLTWDLILFKNEEAFKKWNSDPTRVQALSID